MKKINCILLVDDDHATNYLNKSLISRLGIANYVIEVSDGQKALDYILQQGSFSNNGKSYPSPDLILLDINMAVLDGFEFLEKFHQLESKFRKAAIILLSTSDRKKDFQKARSFPAVIDYLVKPVRKATWVKIINNINRI